MKRRLLLLLAFAFTLPQVVQAQEPPKPLVKLTVEDLGRGEALFNAQCAGCHGIGGGGGRGPSLNRPRLRRAPDDEALVEVLFNGIPGTSMGPAWQLNDRELVQVVAYVRSLGTVEPEVLPGSPARGGELFHGKGACTACHIVQGVGVGLGPELTEIGAMRGGDHLRESLVDPGASLPERVVVWEPRSFSTYAVVEARARDGREIVGQRVNEDSFTIQLRDADGELHSLRKGDLVSLEKPPGRSAMPGYGDLLEPAEIDDLVAYLASLRGE